MTTAEDSDSHDEQPPQPLSSASLNLTESRDDLAIYNVLSEAEIESKQQQLSSHARNPSRIRTLESAYNIAQYILENNMQEDIGTLLDKNTSNINKDTKRSPKMNGVKYGQRIPTALLCLELDRRRTKSKLFTSLLLFIIYFTAYITTLVFTHDAEQAHKLHQAIKYELLEKSIAYGSDSLTFYSITSMDGFFVWFEGVWLETLYNSYWYSNTTTDLYSDPIKHSIGYQTTIVGGFRLEQKRGTYDDGIYCYTMDENTRDFAPDCQSFTSDTNDITCDGRIVDNCTSFDNNIDTPFQYRCDSFNACGFYMDFMFNDSNDNDLSSVISSVNSQLRDVRWFDSQTRSIHILANFYNNNFKRWISCNLVITIDLAGKFESSAVIRAMNIVLFNKYYTISIIVIICESIYLCMVVFYTCKCIQRLIYHKYRWKEHIFGNEKAWFKWLFLILNYYIIIIYMVIIYEPTRLKMLKISSADTDFQTYHDLQSIVDLDKHFIVINSINIVISTLMCFSFFQMTDSGEAIYFSMVNAMPLVMNFMPIYILLLTGFSLCGYFLFGLENAEFATFEQAFLSIIEINFGYYGNVPTLITNADVVGKIYVLLTIFVFVTILLNIFLAIIMQAWDTFNSTRDEIAKKMTFGVRSIAFVETVQCWFYRLPMIKVRNALRLKSEFSSEIGENEFLVVCKQLNIDYYQSLRMTHIFWSKSNVSEKDEYVDDAIWRSSSSAISLGIHSQEKEKPFDVRRATSNVDVLYYAHQSNDTAGSGIGNRNVRQVSIINDVENVEMQELEDESPP